MGIYKIQIYFESFKYENISSTIKSKLPTNFEISSIKFNKIDDDLYFSELFINANNSINAKEKAIVVIENILSLFAISDDAFRISYGYGIKSEKMEDDENIKVIMSNKNENIIYLDEQIDIEDSLLVIKEVVKIEFERKAFSDINSWPDWLKTAIKLNYIAILSHDIKTMFITQYSVLEVLTNAFVNISPPILQQSFKDKNTISDFLLSIKKTCIRYGMSNIYINRIINRISDSESLSRADLIAMFLDKAHIKYDKSQIKLVSKQRGAIIHTGKIIDHEKFNIASQLTKRWVQSSIKYIIDYNIIKY